MRRIRFQPYIYLVFSIFIVLIFYDTVSRAYLWRTGKILAGEAVPYQRLMATSTERVLMIGDSTVVGAGASNPLKTIAGRFGTECQNWEIVNMGKNGDRTVRLVNRVKFDNIGHFDLAIIQIGGNDVVYATPISQIEEDINLILKKVKSLSSHVMLMSTGNPEIAPLFPWYLDDVYSARSQQINQLFSDAAVREGVVFISTAEQSSSIVDSNYWASDHFHPSDSGYDLWYGLIKRRLEQAGTLELRAGGVDGKCIIN
ncbi:MAG: SGNH/GDSL hydrolase family protein [bacterium]